MKKPLAWLKDEVKSPPFSKEARITVGTLLGLLQYGEKVSMPHSRPMPSIGPRCHELRIKDKRVNWRIYYRIDKDAIVIAAVHQKKTGPTPKYVIDLCKQRLRYYDACRR